jgi:hypothetical protein
MRQNNVVINVVEPRSITIPIIRENTFTLRKDRPCLWLQKIALFILKKLGAHDMGDFESMTHHVIDQKDLLSKLSLMWTAIWEFEDRPPVAVYMGQDEFYSLCGSHPSSGLVFTINGPQSFRDMKIIVVPWMRGILPISSNYLP